MPRTAHPGDERIFMEMTAGDVVFLDTNVLLSATTPARQLHQAALTALNRWPNEGVELCTSGQVLREYVLVATRPLESNGLGLTVPDAIANRDMLENRMRFLEETRAVSARLRQIVLSLACTGKQVHDANVVATVLSHGVDRIVTENVDDFRRFEELVDLFALGEV
jgi:predicted nucleic acid-binding protein